MYISHSCVGSWLGVDQAPSHHPNQQYFALIGVLNRNHVNPEYPRYTGLEIEISKMFEMWSSEPSLYMPQTNCVITPPVLFFGTYLFDGTWEITLYSRFCIKSSPFPSVHYSLSVWHKIKIWVMEFHENHLSTCHYGDVIMSTIASQITSLTIVYSTVYSDADQRTHQSTASLAFVWGIHRGPVNFPHKWPVTRKMFPVDDVNMSKSCQITVLPGTQSPSKCLCHHSSFWRRFVTYAIFWLTKFSRKHFDP